MTVSGTLTTKAGKVKNQTLFHAGLPSNICQWSIVYCKVLNNLLTSLENV